jgi:hypothetical protein
MPAVFSVDPLRGYMTQLTVFLSERMLHNDYYSKGSVEIKRFLVVSLKELDVKTELIGDKPPVVK